MEQSKSVSVIIARLKLAYPYYFDKLSDEEFIGLVNLYQEELGSYNYQILSLAIKQLIRNSRYMPSLADIIFEYRKQHKEVCKKLIQNSKVEDKDYLLNMVEWYSCKENYPQNMPNELLDKIEPLIQNGIITKKINLIGSGENYG